MSNNYFEHPDMSYYHDPITNSLPTVTEPSERTVREQAKAKYKEAQTCLDKILKELNEVISQGT